MARSLLILRHAKSAWDTDAASDFARPLAKRGQKDAPRMGKWLASQGLVPEHVVSSPAERAKQTTLSVCQKLGIGASAVKWDPRVYAAGLDGLLQALADCPAKAKTVLLVGHNPSLETLLVHLCGDSVPLPQDGKLLPTAAVAVVKIPGDWSAVKPGAATLVSITRPDAVELD